MSISSLVSVGFHKVVSYSFVLVCLAKVRVYF